VSSGAPHPPRDDADAMRWVANVLLGELADDPDIVVGQKAPSGHRVLWAFSVLPGGDDPYVLLPADAPRAAAAAVHGLGNPLRTRDRAVEAAAGLAMRARVGTVKVEGAQVAPDVFPQRGVATHLNLSMS